jgi:hypothetical protein
VRTSVTLAPFEHTGLLNMKLKQYAFWTQMTNYLNLKKKPYVVYPALKGRLLFWINITATFNISKFISISSQLNVTLPANYQNSTH